MSRQIDLSEGPIYDCPICREYWVKWQASSRKLGDERMTSSNLVRELGDVQGQLKGAKLGTRALLRELASIKRAIQRLRPARRSAKKKAKKTAKKRGKRK